MSECVRWSVSHCSVRTRAQHIVACTRAVVALDGPARRSLGPHYEGCPTCRNETRGLRVFVFFFFQAEDGIRDHCVTGVQTCALPIYFLSGFDSAFRAGKTVPGAPQPEMS